MTDPETRDRCILAVDPGERRYGVAVADLETRFAYPLEVIDAREVDPVERVAELVAERSAVKVVVGRPVGLSGRAGPAVEARIAFLDALRSKGIDVVEHDERLTTVIAEQGLRAGGHPAGARAAQRDAVAAQVLLQSFLDAGL